MVRPARLKADRVACINRIRGLLAEFGLVFAQSPAALEAVLTDTLEDASNEMNSLARLVLQRAQSQWRELDAATRSRNGRRPSGTASVGRRSRWRWPTDELASCGR